MGTGAGYEGENVLVSEFRNSQFEQEKSCPEDPAAGLEDGEVQQRPPCADVTRFKRLY